MSLVRAPFLDEYVEAGEAVLLLEDGHVVALSALATEIVRLVAVGHQQVESLADQLVQTFGAPETGSNLDITRRAVGSLVEEGVLRATAGEFRSD